MQRYDFVELPAAKVTPEGWIFDKPVLSRTGVFTYHNADGTTRREYRPPEEVFSDDALASLRGVPVTDGHPGQVSKDLAHANIGAVLTPGERADDNVVADIVIHDPKRMGPRRELSLGYSLTLDETPGVTPTGENYDAIQRDIRINHLAVVHRGRAGNARLRLDRHDAASGHVDNTEDGMEPTNLVTVRVDGIDYKASPEVSREIEKLRGDVTAQRGRADKAEAERDTLRADGEKAKAAHAEELAKVRSDALAQARVRGAIEADAKRFGVEVKADAKDREIREAVIRKLRGDEALKFDGRSDEYVAAAYDMAVEAAGQGDRRDHSGDQRLTATGGGDVRRPAGRVDAATAYAKSVEDMTCAWMNPGGKKEGN